MTKSEKQRKVLMGGSILWMLTGAIGILKSLHNLIHTNLKNNPQLNSISDDLTKVINILVSLTSHIKITYNFIVTYDNVKFNSVQTTPDYIVMQCSRCGYTYKHIHDNYETENKEASKHRCNNQLKT